MERKRDLQICLYIHVTKYSMNNGTFETLREPKEKSYRIIDSFFL